MKLLIHASLFLVLGAPTWWAIQWTRAVQAPTTAGCYCKSDDPHAMCFMWTQSDGGWRAGATSDAGITIRCAWSQEDGPVPLDAGRAVMDWRAFP